MIAKEPNESNFDQQDDAEEFYVEDSQEAGIIRLAASLTIVAYAVFVGYLAYGIYTSRSDNQQAIPNASPVSADSAQGK